MEKDLDHVIDDVAGLEGRVGALEARYSALEARQLRTENLLGELRVEAQRTSKTLKALVMDNELLMSKSDRIILLLQETQRMIRPAEEPPRDH